MSTPTQPTPIPAAQDHDAPGHVHGPGCAHGHHHHHHEKQSPFVRAEPKLGRNDPCNCGSGKKYKKCCAAGSP